MQRMSSICLSQLTFNVLFWFYFIAHFVYLYLCTFHVRIKIMIIYIYIYIYIYIVMILDNCPISSWTYGQHSREDTSDARRVIREAGDQEWITSRPWLHLCVTTSRVSATSRRLGECTWGRLRECKWGRLRECKWGRACIAVQRVCVLVNTCVGLESSEVDE